MSPAHRDLHRPQSVMSRQIKQLWVESEPLDGLLLEDNLALFPPERLESTLGIHKWQPQDQPHYLVEDNAGKLPERRLVHGDQAPVHGARPDRYVMILHRRQQLLHLFN